MEIISISLKTCVYIHTYTYIYIYTYTYTYIYIYIYMMHRVMVDLHFPPSKLCCQINQLSEENPGLVLARKPWWLHRQHGTGNGSFRCTLVRRLKNGTVATKKNISFGPQPSSQGFRILPNSSQKFPIMCYPWWFTLGRASTESSNRRIRGAGKGPCAIRRPKGSTKRAWGITRKNHMKLQ